MTLAHPFKKWLGLIAYFALNLNAWSAASLNDLGLQQVVEVKEKHFGGAVGYRFEVLVRSNPFYIDGPVGKATKAPVMHNTAYAIGEAGNYGLGMGVMQHSVGLVYGRTSYLRDLLKVFNHDNQTLFIDNTYLYPGNWSISVGFRNMRLINVDDGVTDYQGWSPSLSLDRFFLFSGGHQLSMHLRNEWKFSEIQGVPMTDLTQDRLNHWSTDFGIDHKWQLFDTFSLRSHGGVKFSKYSKGSNRDRNDTLLGIRSSLYWTPSKLLSASIFVDHTNRLSSLDRNTYTNWDGGLRLESFYSF